ncbi:MAG: hypothetical protein R3B13_25150 [Polyangiaceae bacterium]
MGREQRRGHYCTTSKDKCSPFDDLTCRGRTSCLFDRTYERWMCVPVTMLGHSW